MPKPRLTGVEGGALSLSGGLSWEYVASNKDLARRVLLMLESRRVLTETHERDEPDFCRQSAQTLREFLTLEMMNVKHGGDLEDCFRSMRTACRVFVSAAGGNSTNFSADAGYFQACLRAFRDAMGSQIGWLVQAFSIDIEPELAAIVPRQDLSFVPGFEGNADGAVDV
jgi:hypothetical protein